MPRTIAWDDLVEEIAQELRTMPYEGVEDIANQVLHEKVRYDEDGFFIVGESEEEEESCL